MKALLNSEEVFQWMTNRKKYYYFAQYTGPFLPGASALLVLATGNANWFWFTVIMFYFAIAILDLIGGKDLYNAQPELEKELKEDRFYTHIMFVLLPLYFMSYALTIYAVTVVPMSLLQYFAAVVGVGAMFAGVFCVGHELGHRTNDKWEYFGAQFAVALYGYGHFHVEHNRGHHVQVSTPEDPASARMGENVYQFMLREIPATYKRAIRLEKERLLRKGLSFWSIENKILQSYAMTLTIYTAFVIAFGLSIITFLLACMFAGYFQLTMANYLEHYGLLRQKLENGRYEKCQPHHSWNSNHLVSNAMTLQLQRHSDHHASATRHYQILRDYENVPQLPAGYPFMQFMSMIPPFWRKVMDKRLLEFVNYDMNKVNVDPKKKDQLFAKYHRAKKM